MPITAWSRSPCPSRPGTVETNRPSRRADVVAMQGTGAVRHLQTYDIRHRRFGCGTVKGMPVRREAPVPLSWDQVRGHRLRRHHLLEPSPAGTAVEVASTVCGIHGQVASAAALSLARRVSGADVGLLNSALWQERSLVKTYGPRGTVHVLPAQELTLWTAATRALPAQGARQPQPDVSTVCPSSTQTAQLRAAVLSASRGSQLTRQELGTAIIAECGPWVDTPASAAFSGAHPHWRLAVDEAVARGALCFGAPRGNRVTFVRTDEWLPNSAPGQVWTAEDGTRYGDVPAVLVEIARRYLGAYGPATHQEFGQWFTLPDGQARRVYAALEDEIVPVAVAGHRSWALRDSDPESWEPVTDCVRLLGYFDCFAVGCHPRDEFAPPEAATRAAPHGRGFGRGSARRFLCGPLPVLLVDGLVRGVWTYRRHDQIEHVRVEVFGRAGRGLRRLLREEVARLAGLLNRDLTLSVGPADIAAHL